MNPDPSHDAMRKPPIQAVVCDFGNVVAFFDHRLTTNRLAKHTGLAPDELHGRLFGSRLEEDYDAGRLSTPEFLSLVREACQLCCSEDAIAAAWADIFWPNEALARLLPLLKSRYRLLLASNTNELHSHQFRRQFAGTLRSFEAMILSHEVGARKPDPKFFQHCQQLAGCRAREGLFIDDLPENVAGARSCGWYGILYTGFPELCRELVRLDILSEQAAASLNRH